MPIKKIGRNKIRVIYNDGNYYDYSLNLSSETIVGVSFLSQDEYVIMDDHYKRYKIPKEFTFIKIKDWEQFKDNAIYSYKWLEVQDVYKEYFILKHKYKEVRNELNAIQLTEVVKKDEIERNKRLKVYNKQLKQLFLKDIDNNIIYDNITKIIEWSNDKLQFIINDSSTIIIKDFKHIETNYDKVFRGFEELFHKE